MHIPNEIVKIVQAAKGQTISDLGCHFFTAGVLLFFTDTCLMYCSRGALLDI